MKQTARILGTSPSLERIGVTLPLLRAGTLVAALTAGSLLLTGCGLKGPLYLPAPGTNSPGAASAPTTP